MFIVLEGIDGCGKSTQAKLLHDWIASRRKRVELTAEPTRDKIGNIIREVISGSKKADPKTLALLFTADRSEHIKEVIEPNLAEGNIVISERYYHSTIAYQSAQGVDMNWLMQINSFARRPDLTIFIDVKPEIAIKNIKEKIEKRKQTIEKKMAELRDARERYSREASRYQMHMYDSFIKKDRTAIARMPLEVSPQNINKQMNDISAEIRNIEEELNREKNKYLEFEKFENLTGFGEGGYEKFLTNVYENYSRLTDMTFVNGNQSIEKVSEEIKAIVSKVSNI